MIWAFVAATVVLAICLVWERVTNEKEYRYQEKRIKDLMGINEYHQMINGTLRQEVDHWKHEATVWKKEYEEVLKR